MRKALIAAVSLCLLVALLMGLQLGFLRIEASVYYLLLLDLTLVALLALVFLVGRSLLQLMAERRQKALGYRFKTRVVAIFLVLTSIPAGLLFLGSSGLGTNYIERLFSAQYREPIERSVELAAAFYDMERSRALHYARLARSGWNPVAPSPVAGSPPPAYYRVQRFDKEPPQASMAMRAAFLGREESEVISGPESDTVRAYIPEGPEGKPGGGIIVVESSIPPGITKSLNGIKATYEDYVKLESWRTPLKLNYLLLLGLLTMLIIFASLWFSLRIAGWITEPVRSLASATEEVASGNLSVRVETRRQDEMGLLIGSFNRMVSELKDGKESLEKAYLQSDHRRLTMENILENIHSGVISLDSEGRVLTINPSACRMLGLRAGALTGKHYSEMLASIESEGSEELQAFIREIDLRTIESLERRLRVSIEGRRLDLRVFVSGLRSAQGQYLGLLVVLDDLTEVISAQMAIAWQEVARRIAHEIKNPLTPIKLSAERMLKKWRAGDKDFAGSFLRAAETIIREADGMKRLLDEFSRFGRMPRITKAPADIRAIVDDVIALYGDNLLISVSAPEVLPRAALDAEQLRRALINLFDNALDAMGGGSRISIAIRPETEANRLIIEVADEGPGIREEDKEKLFQPYFSTKKDGRGLGLAIAERIISEHGGNIRVSDNVPRGTIFTVELPIN